MLRRFCRTLPRRHACLGAVRWCGDEAHMNPSDAYAAMRADVVAQLGKNPADGPAWNDLGVLAGGTSVAVAGAEYTERDCYITSLRYGPTADCWNNLAATLAPSETVALAGDVAYSRVACHIQALRIDAGHWASWLNLALALDPAATVYIGDRRVGRAECFAEAVRHNTGRDDAASIDASSGRLMCLLGLGAAASQTGPVTDAAGDVHTAVAAFAAAAALDSHCAEAWAGLGDALPPGETHAVAGAAVTPQDCFVRALQLNPSTSAVWSSLGDALAWHPAAPQHVFVGGAEVDRLQCQAAAVRNDIANGAAWRKLGEALLAVPGRVPSPVHVGNAQYSAVDCLARAVVYDARNPVAWDLLAEALGGGKVRVDTKTLSAVGCREEAARLRHAAA